MQFTSRSILVLICLTFLFVSFVESQEKPASNLLLIRVSSKAGFIDRTGKIVIEPQFDDAEKFSDGIAPVKIKDKWGFIDESGKIIIEPKFNYIIWHFFSEGLIPVQFGEKMGTIDKSGNFIIEPKFEMVLNFSEGIAPVRIGKSEYSERWIYVDRLGNQVINKQFFGADSFVDGRAFVKVGFDEWALIDKSGREITKKHFNSFAHFGMFAEGLVAVKVKNKYGYIDRNGKFIIKPKFNYASNFQEGLAAVNDGCNYGFINQKGEYVVKPQFSFAGDFSEGLAAVSSGQEKTVIKVESSKRLCLGFGHGRTGYIDKTGKMIIPPNFGRAFDFENGIAQVSFGEPSDVIGFIGERGYIDKSGKYIWKPTK